MRSDREINREPSFHEMLADPVMQTILTHDNVTPTDLELLIRTMGRRFAGHLQRNPNLYRSPATIIGRDKF